MLLIYKKIFKCNKSDSVFKKKLIVTLVKYQKVFKSNQSHSVFKEYNFDCDGLFSAKIKMIFMCKILLIFITTINILFHNFNTFNFDVFIIRYLSKFKLNNTQSIILLNNSDIFKFDFFMSVIFKFNKFSITTTNSSFQHQNSSIG